MRWAFGRVRVEGPSMAPTYPAGSWLVVRWAGGRRLRVAPGTVVVARRPDRPALLIVKRAVRPAGEGGYWLEGDNPAASDDSRSFGPVPQELILGRVLFRYWLARPAGAPRRAA